jgi:histidine ammonia-lyase
MVLLDRSDTLDLELYRRVAVGGEQVEIPEERYEHVAERRATLLALVESGTSVYGVTTGLGYLTSREIGIEDQAVLQRSLLTARASGVGPPLPEYVVRGVMLLRLGGFLSGYAGVSTALCRFLCDRLNEGWSPVVPSGPFGAAGEIGPLCHLFQTFIGEGLVQDAGSTVGAAEALARRGLEPYEPGVKEGGALLNGSPFATALAIHAGDRCRALLEHAQVAAALAVDLVGASTRPYARRLGELANDPAQLRVHERMLELLGGASFEDKLQAPVSFRVVPQVHGALLDQLEVLEQRVERRLSAVTDSPLLLEAEAEEPEGMYPSGGFHAAALAGALDGLAIGVAQLTNLHEKLLHRVLDTRFSGLPEQLAREPGLQAGAVSLHKAAVALAVENRMLAAPASVHATDTSAGQEDVQAFGLLAAEKLGRALDNLELALACELVALRQGYHLRGASPSAPLLARAVAKLEGVVPPIDQDRTLSGDLSRVRGLLQGAQPLT